jgi:hypothetical protein
MAEVSHGSRPLELMGMSGGEDPLRAAIQDGSVMGMGCAVQACIQPIETCDLCIRVSNMHLELAFRLANLSGAPPTGGWSCGGYGLGLNQRFCPSWPFVYATNG